MGKHYRCTKKGFTVVLCAVADGTKSLALVIFNGRNGEIGPRVRHSIRVPENVHITAIPSGW